MDVRIVALAKAVKDKAFAAAREGLSVGTHPVDCRIHITGSLKVGEDGQTDIRGQPVNYKGAFATVCGMLVQQCKLRKQPLSDELLEDLIGMAMRQDELASKIGDPMLKIVESMERDCTTITGTKTKRGPVTTKLDYRFVAVPVALAS